MSGSLSSLGLGGVAGGTLGSVMGGNIAGSALASVLAMAAFRGVTFYMPDSTDEIGRRVIQLYFPGRDGAKYPDLGALDGEIHVNGLLIGDDYVIQADRICKALLKPGPATLVHPWWGRLQVRVLGRPRIGFAENRVRVATFSATFVRVPPAASSTGLFASITNSLTNMLEQADAMVDSAILAAQQLLAPLAIPLALESAVSSWVSQATGIWDAVTGSAPQPVQDAVATPLATLSAGVPVPASNTDTTYADAVSSALAGVPAAIANAITPTDTAAIAPASLVVNGVVTTVDPANAVTMLLTAGAQMSADAQALVAQSGNAAAVLTLALISRAMTVAQTVAAQAAVTYVSQQDAMTARDALMAGVDGLATDLTSAAAAGAPVDVGGIWATIRDLRAAIAADFTSLIGRLPAVEQIDVPMQMTAWAIAYAVSGDTPANVQATHDDLVTRNGLLAPTLAGPGTLSVLEQTSS